MAFSYTTDLFDKHGKVTKVYGTWNAASVTSGAISFGPIVGNSIKIAAAGVSNSVTATSGNPTIWKALQGGATTQCSISIGACVSNDTGYWFAEWYGG